MHLKWIAVAASLAAAMLPFGVGAQPRPPQPPPEPQGPLAITIVKENAKQGSATVQQGAGDTGIAVAAAGTWRTSSVVRRITDVFGRVYADDVSTTSLDWVPFGVGVGGDIGLNGSKVYSCGAFNYGQKVASCETQDVRVPGNVRGTGRHEYEDTGGRQSLGTTDTGWNWLQ